MSGDKLALGAVAALAALGLAKRRGSRGQYTDQFADLIRAGDIDYAKELASVAGVPLDLSNADLTGASLSGANLTDANLHEADLRHADLDGASLSGANLIGANLSRAHLTGSDLSRANLWGADLRGADLTGADLRGADLFDVWYDEETDWPDGFTPPTSR